MSTFMKERRMGGGGGEGAGVLADCHWTRFWTMDTVPAVPTLHGYYIAVIKSDHRNSLLLFPLQYKFGQKLKSESWKHIIIRNSKLNKDCCEVLKKLVCFVILSVCLTYCLSAFLTVCLSFWLSVCLSDRLTLCVSLTVCAVGSVCSNFLPPLK